MMPMRSFLRYLTGVMACLICSASSLCLPARTQVQGDDSFPEVHNWKNVVITLSRDACYGTCPMYTVELHGDGTVVYRGKRFVAVKGERRGKVAEVAVQDLVAEFRKADFFSLSDQYIAGVTDFPSYTISIEIDGKKKTVLDYVGGQVGMPRTVTDLENDIDRIAGSDRWVRQK